MKRKQKIVLFLILGIATALRFWRLGKYPALNADEASIGYDAYSLLLTGRDQHGNPWPFSFQSFNDYKPGLIVYLVLPFIKTFGLSVFWLRFLPALLGVITVYLIYLMVKELKFENSFEIRNHKVNASEIAALMLAISPWHIHFSRGAWEVNVSTFFIVLGVYLYLKSLKKQRLLLLSTFSFVLSVYSYHSATVITPLLMLGLIIIYKDRVMKFKKRTVIVSGVVAAVLLTPVLFEFLGGTGLRRASGIGLTADPGIAERTKEQQLEHFIDGGYSKYFARIIHNKYVNLTLTFAKNWTSHYNGNFLFVSGDGIQRNKVPDMGQMYLADILWLIFGLLWMVNNIKSKSARFVIWWLIVAPVAAAATYQSPHALRSQNMVIPLVIIISVGLVTFINFIKHRIKNSTLSFTVYTLLYVIVVWNFVFYLHQYYIHMSSELPYSSQYGVLELVDYMQTEIPNDKNIVVTDRYDQPYVLFLFYLKYPPDKFQSGHELTEPDKYGFSTVREFDKYKFINLDWDNDKVKYQGSIIAGAPEQIPQEANIIKRIYGTNGFEYFDVVAN